MRLRERDKTCVTVCRPEGMDDDVYLWGECYDIRAAVYPNNRSIDAAVYGDKIRDTRLMLYDGDLVRLDVGMGVSLDGGAPKWRVMSVEGWAHQMAVIMLIPEGRRSGGDND